MVESSYVEMDRENENEGVQETEGAKKKGARRAKVETGSPVKVESEGVAGDEVKTRLLVVTPADHPFSHFLAEVKKRGIKDFDPAQLVLEALDKLDASWWEDKLDGITPLEYKITAALNDPNMRERLTTLLASQKFKVDAASNPSLQ